MGNSKGKEKFLELAQSNQSTEMDMGWFTLTPKPQSQGGERWNSDKKQSRFKIEDQNHPKRVREPSEFSWRSRRNSTFLFQHLQAGVAMTPLRSCSEGEQFSSFAHLLFRLNGVLGAKKARSG